MFAVKIMEAMERTADNKIWVVAGADFDSGGGGGDLAASFVQVTVSPSANINLAFLP